MVPLLTPRLVLALPEPADAHRLVEYFVRNADHLAPFEPPRPPDFLTETYWRTRLAQNLREADEGVAVRLAIRARSDAAGPVIGVCNLSQIFRGPLQRCVLGFSLDRDRVGQGLMHEALARAVAYAFEELGLHRIEANHLPDNARSARLLGRLGFVTEGYAKEYLFIAGRWRDHVLTSLTRGHSPGIQPADIIGFPEAKIQST
jgi:ribosomal-protein-alanine N-acetyltransferase